MTKIQKIKQLRSETEISIAECKKALEVSGGDLGKAKEILRIWGKELASKKAARMTGQGTVSSYIHPNNRVGVLLDLRCESDFVAMSQDFQKLAHEICLQIASMDPGDVNSLIAQPWIRDGEKTIKDLVQEEIAKIGENIIIKDFVRYEI